MSQSTQFTPQPAHRLHSGYNHPLIKQWQNSLVLTGSDLVYPIFVVDEDNLKAEITSMPNQYRWSVNRLHELLDPLVELGLKSVLLFGVLNDDSKKTANADFCTNEMAPVPRAIKFIAKRYPTLFIMCDICLCAYTNTGHCGIMNMETMQIDNQPSINRLAEMAVYYAKCGAHCVAPSDMMDGRIGAIKLGLKEAKLDESVSVCSYAAKFASCFYGPFRDAASSGAKFGDRSRYQLPPYSRGLAERAVDRDIIEGADIVMCKPAGPYLDIVRDMANTTKLPIAVYHVSGEYAMLWHAAKAGAFKLEEAVMETLYSFRRAGAQILITYFAPYVLQLLADKAKEEKKNLINTAIVADEVKSNTGK